jgi:CPA1 family monovalent cation:H+ antiporter
MRGMVSLAAALALPLTTASGAPFPGRDLIVFLSYGVIFVTLVIQGTSLSALIRWLKVGESCDVYEEERIARRETARAAIAAVSRLAAADGLDREAVEGVRGDYERRLLEIDAADPCDAAVPALRLRQAQRELRLAALAAARRRLIRLRRDLVIGDEVLHKVQRELDLDEVRFRGV